MKQTGLMHYQSITYIIFEGSKSCNKGSTFVTFLEDDAVFLLEVVTKVTMGNFLVTFYGTLKTLLFVTIIIFFLIVTNVTNVTRFLTFKMRLLRFKKMRNLPHLYFCKNW